MRKLYLLTIPFLILTACSTTQKSKVVKPTIKQKIKYKTDSCQDINSFVATDNFNVELLTKLYKNCPDKNVQTALLIAKGDRYKKKMNLQDALLSYQKALNLIQENRLELFDEHKLYLKQQIKNINKSNKKSISKVKDSSIIDSKSLEGYIMPRDKNSTRGAMMGEFSRVKGIPLNFSTGSYYIEEGVNLAQAREIGKLLSKNYRDKTIYITGYTDTRGDSTSNQELSVKRAEGLKNYLLENFGLKDDNIRAEGYGESFPICLFGRKEKLNNEYYCKSENDEVGLNNLEDYDRSRRVTLEYGE